MMNGHSDNTQVDASESTEGELQSPSKGNLEGSLSGLDDIFGEEKANMHVVDVNDKDLVSTPSSMKSKRLSESLIGRVSKFNLNPTDGSFLSPMQLSVKKKVPDASLLRPLSFSPEPKRLSPTKTIRRGMKNFDGTSRGNTIIDLRSPQDVKKLVKSKDNQKLEEILTRYEMLAAENALHRRELAHKLAARERHRRNGRNTLSDEERARLLKLNQARLFRTGSERVLETDIFLNAADDGILNNKVWAEQYDFEDFVPPSFSKTENQRNLILGVIERSFVFSEFRKYGKARCEGAVEMLVDAFESVKYPSGHILLQSGTKKENDEFYVLEKGRLDFEIDGKLVAEIDEVGGFFGELSLLHTVLSERSVLVFGSSGRAGRLLKIKQKTFRGILNICSKRAAQERREALLSVDFLSNIIKENEELIRQLSSIMIREEMESDETFNLLQNDTFVVIRSGRVEVTSSNDVFDAGNYFGSQALIKNLPEAEQNKIDMVACSDTVVFFRIEHHAMGQIVGISRLQNLMDMHRFASTPLIEQSNISSDVQDLMAETIAEKTIDSDEETWLVGKNDPPAVYIVREGALNVSTHDRSTGNQIETLVTAGSIFGMDQLKFTSRNGKAMYRRCGGLKASNLKGQSISIGVLPLHEVSTPFRTKSNGSALSDEFFSDDSEGDKLLTYEWGSKTSAALGLRATVKDAVESNISFEDLEKIRLLGEGEFGEVWLVSADIPMNKSRTTKRRFALKTQLIADDNRGMDATEAILREIRIMKELNHPQIVDIVTTYQEVDSIHMLMRLVPYGELWDRLHIEDEDGNWTSGLSEDAAKFYSISIADTLNFIHSKGIIYRDLKPENVLIDVDGYPVIADFGCSKFCPNKAYTFVGTPNYVAPEMITNAGHNRGVDIWAFGVIVYEMVSGEHPFFFEGVDQISLYHSICHEEHFPLSQDFDKDCIDLVDSLLKKDPIERLGMHRAGMNDIIQHKWFEGIDLEQIRKKSFPAPWIPNDLIRDGFESFNLEDKSRNESMKSYISMNSIEESETQERSHSDEQVEDSFSSAAEIPKLSNSSVSSFISGEETKEKKEPAPKSDEEEKPKAKKKKKKKSKKSKESKPKNDSSLSELQASFSDRYGDPDEPQFVSVKTRNIIKNPALRFTKTQKMERQTRRDLLKNSLDMFGIGDGDSKEFG